MWFLLLLKLIAQKNKVLNTKTLMSSELYLANKFWAVVCKLRVYGIHVFILIFSPAQKALPYVMQSLL